MSRTRGRRPGGLDTRSAIVAEARRQFGDVGFGATTLRNVASAVGVDPRLVLHYFGSKKGLFEAAIELPIDPEIIVNSVLRAEGGDLGMRTAQFMVSALDDPARRQVLTGLIRAAVSDPEAVPLIRDVLAERMLLPIARGVGADQPELRAALMASQVVGLAIARHVVGIEPLASAPPDLLVRALAPVVRHYLAGDWPDGPVAAGSDPPGQPPALE
jgi:AcrR family transcriptional regulator